MSTEPSAFHSTFECITCNPSERPESQDELIRCLSRSPLLAGLSRDQYREVASAAQEFFYSEDETVFLEDDPVQRVLVVASGAVKITRVTEDGSETLLRLERAGDWIDDSVGSLQVHSVCARVTQDTVLLAWEIVTFDALVARMPAIERNMIAIMGSRLHSLQQRYCDLSTLPVSQRVARAVLQLATGPENALTLSREELAQMTATSMFTVSRLLSSWAESEIVTLERRKVSIEDRDRLLELAEVA